MTVSHIAAAVALVGAVAAWQNPPQASCTPTLCDGMAVIYEQAPAATRKAIARTDKWKSPLSREDRATWLLRMLMFGEARSNGIAGMQAAGSVAWNRAGHDIRRLERVVYARRQFSFWNDRNRTLMYGARHFTGANELRWKQAGVLAILIVGGKLHDPTKGATFYHASYVKPVWARGMKLVARIGDHQFYRGS